jgi:hypothetical protein
MTVGRMGGRRKRVPRSEMSSRVTDGSLLVERVSVDRYVDLRGPTHLGHHPHRLRSRCDHHNRLLRGHEAWARANGMPDHIGVEVLGSLSHDGTERGMQSQLRYMIDGVRKSRTTTRTEQCLRAGPAHTQRPRRQAGQRAPRRRRAYVHPRMPSCIVKRVLQCMPRRIKTIERLPMSLGVK